MEEILSRPAVCLALLGVLVMTVGLMCVRRDKMSTAVLVQTSLLLALAVVLEQLRIFHMPQGGSITVGSMVPLLLIGYRFGVGTGMLAGFVYGMINMFQDPFILHPVQVLFDYPLPFMAMGLAGLSRQYLYLGTGLAFFARFCCHFISGVVFFGSYAPEGMSPVWYSLVANATYLMPEMLICCAIIKVLPVKKITEQAIMSHM